MTPAEQARADVKAWAFYNSVAYHGRDADVDDLIARLVPVYERASQADERCPCCGEEFYVCAEVNRKRAERAEAEVARLRGMLRSAAGNVCNCPEDGTRQCWRCAARLAYAGK